MNQATNGYSSDLVKGLFAEIDAQDDELASLRGSYMEECQGPRSAIKEIKARAREEGINPVAFAELLAQHRSARAEQKRLAKMEPEDVDAFNLLEQALGDFVDTPLGAAAMDKARPSGDEVLDSFGR
jgi:hypothetical protein